MKMQLQLLSPSSHPTYKQSSANATTLAKPLFPPHLKTNSHVKMQLQLLSPSATPPTNSHVRMQLQLLSPSPTPPTNKQSCM